jgi:hypothetical protein
MVRDASTGEIGYMQRQYSAVAMVVTLLLLVVAIQRQGENVRGSVTSVPVRFNGMLLPLSSGTTLVLLF